MTYSIFYSWQSDIGNSINRTFIEDALTEAVGRLASAKDDEIAVSLAEREDEFVIDKDTKGVPGSPAIADIILGKIAECAIFVPDLTFVGRSSKGRYLPNPNVLIEYGWALRSISESRIIPVMNSHFGEPGWDTLPFDMRHLRHPFSYNLSPEVNGEEKRKIRETLVRHFVSAISSILESGILSKISDSESPVENIDLIKEYISDDSNKIKLRDLVEKETQAVWNGVYHEDLISIPGNFEEDEFRRRGEVFEHRTENLRGLLAAGCLYGEPRHADLWIGAIERLDELASERQSGLTVYLALRRYPAMIAFQTCAFSSFFSGNYETMYRLLNEGEYNSEHPDESPAESFAPDILFSGRALGLLYGPPPEGERWIEPQSMHLENMLIGSMKGLVATESDKFGRSFDRFEYLYRIIVTDLRFLRGEERPWAPPGRFAIRDPSGDANNVFDYFKVQAQKYGDDWALLKAGFFGGDMDRFLKAKNAIDPYLRRAWMDYF